MTLEADFAALLAELAGSAAPLDRIDDWFDAHEQDAFAHDGAVPRPADRPDAPAPVDGRDLAHRR